MKLIKNGSFYALLIGLLEATHLFLRAGREALCVSMPS